MERGLAVVISMWGNSEWISKPMEGMQEFVEVWDQYAIYYKDYPENLVFDLWNEPAGLLVSNGEPQGIDDPETVLKYLDAVIPVIRKTNPDRILGIGGPGLNGGRELAQYVTPQYLSYKLEDGTRMHSIFLPGSIHLRNFPCQPLSMRNLAGQRTFGKVKEL